MDASGGLDDLRDFTKNLQAGKGLPIYTRESDYKTLEKRFEYLVDISKAYH